MKNSYFSHLFIKVKNLKNIRELFEILDFKLVYQDEKYFRFQGDSDFYMGIEENKSGTIIDSNIEIDIWVPNVEKTYKRLLDSGYRVDLPKKMPWGA